MKEVKIDYKFNPIDVLEAFSELLDEIRLELVERWDDATLYLSIKGKSIYKEH